MRESSKPASAPETCIGPNVRIEGDVLLRGSAELNGMIQGNVATDREARVTIGGSVAGSVKGVTLVLLATAHVVGDVFYVELTVHPGARITGVLTQGPGGQS